MAASENGWNICTEDFIKEKDLQRRAAVNEDMK